jgi:hypothetical protein
MSGVNGVSVGVALSQLLTLGKQSRELLAPEGPGQDGSDVLGYEE